MRQFASRSPSEARKRRPSSMSPIQPSLVRTRSRSQLGPSEPIAARMDCSIPRRWLERSSSWLTWARWPEHADLSDCSSAACVSSQAVSGVGLLPHERCCSACRLRSSTSQSRISRSRSRVRRSFRSSSSRAWATSSSKRSSSAWRAGIGGRFPARLGETAREQPRGRPAGGWPGRRPGAGGRARGAGC